MAFRADAPYDDLPPLPPAFDVETPAVLRQCVRTSRALAELKGAVGLIPDAAILINSIPLQEARLSSEVENIVTTQDALFRGDLSTNDADPAAKEVLRYRTALRRGFQEVRVRDLNAALVTEIASVLMDTPMPFRGNNVVIGNPTTGIVTYTPPSGGKTIAGRIDNLIDYLNNDAGPDPLVRMAVGHYQFEAIHPFHDGNGRCGRIINILHLVSSGLLDLPVLYLSRYIIQNKADYYARLLGVTAHGDWEAWNLFILLGVEQTAIWTTGRVRAIRSHFEHVVDICRRKLDRLYSRELIELIFERPYCRIDDVATRLKVERKAASRYLAALAETDILVAEKKGRTVVYKHPGLISILSE